MNLVLLCALAAMWRTLQRAASTLVSTSDSPERQRREFFTPSERGDRLRSLNGDCQLPIRCDGHTGLRFSRNAATPSRKSPDTNERRRYSIAEGS